MARLDNTVRILGSSAASILVLAMLASCTVPRHAPAETLTMSVLGTNDVHGQLLPAADRGGLVAISAYVDALRAARGEDGGALLVIDAGDMWQGTLESNLVEGAPIVAAYNAIGYDAAAIGNHEFDFGPVGDKAIPEQPGDDPRGALKKRIAEAAFPVLAANLIDESTQRPVAWDNVQPSALLDIDGIKVGIIGGVTERALQTTISANTPGLRIAPLVETIVNEAEALRIAGATVVIVTAHAGSTCTRFDDPADLSSCDMSGEIMRVARQLPDGLVDHIIAGHVHEGIAHVVNGISITSSFSSTRAFSRADLEIDRSTGRVVSRVVHAPHTACLLTIRPSGACASPDDDGTTTMPAVYEGREIEPDPVVVDIATRAATFARQIKEEKLGVVLESDFLRPPDTESALANLMTDALREATGADIALHNVVGGIRNSLPAGELTFGAVYEMFPFDNRILALKLNGGQLREIVAHQVYKKNRRAGFSGMRIFVTCTNGKLDIAMRLPDGTAIDDAAIITVIANDFLGFGGDDILTPIMPAGGFDVDDRMPLTRDVLVDWFRAKGGTLRSSDFLTTATPRWNIQEPLPASCTR